ncbi:MAG: class I SAM-dependent methyltransferase [Ardenticatenaceae bacterium]
MNLLDIIHRSPIPEPWAEGEKIPWHVPDFSERMLKEHLTQAHGAASRRSEMIDRHVAWIDRHLLSAQPAKILDLACGPGLYASRLARLGHTCLGIDYAPAAIAYAREQAARAHLDCTYIQEDIRVAEYGSDLALVMLIFGEFNVFKPHDAKQILLKAHRALKPDGILLLEPHTFSAVQALGKGVSWLTTRSGLFSTQPHLRLKENFWDSQRAVATERYYIIDAQTTHVTRYAASIQAYTDEQYRTLFAQSGFGQIEQYPSLCGTTDPTQPDLIVWLARKQ